MKNLLLLIDPQNDFVLEGGALPVPGAVKDMERLTRLIDGAGDRIDTILVTLDTHHPVHIASPIYWENSRGEHPEHFTHITYEEVAGGKWKARYHADLAPVYLQKLNEKGRQLIIWPPHTLFGASGWAIYEPLFASVCRWIHRANGNFATHVKGYESEKTEMFSAVRPDVSFDPETDGENARRFLSRLDGYDRILVAGEAEDFCLKESVADIMLLRPDLAGRLVVLEDCTSAIKADEADKMDSFWRDCAAKGLALVKSTEL